MVQEPILVGLGRHLPRNCYVRIMRSRSLASFFGSDWSAVSPFFTNTKVLVPHLPAERIFLARDKCLSFAGGRRHQQRPLVRRRRKRPAGSDSYGRREGDSLRACGKGTAGGQTARATAADPAGQRLSLGIAQGSDLQRQEHREHEWAQPGHGSEARAAALFACLAGSVFVILRRRLFPKYDTGTGTHELRSPFVMTSRQRGER